MQRENAVMTLSHATESGVGQIQDIYTALLLKISVLKVNKGDMMCNSSHISISLNKNENIKSVPNRVQTPSRSYDILLWAV